VIVNQGNSTCPFCKNKADKIEAGSDERFLFSCNICAHYFISSDLRNEIKVRPLDNGLLNCISENIKTNSKSLPAITAWHSRHGITIPRYNGDVMIKYFEDYVKLPIIHSEKTKNFLMLMAEKLSECSPFDECKIFQEDLWKIKILDFDECFEWAKALEKDELIVNQNSILRTIDDDSSKRSSVFYTITPKGWETIFQNQKSINSKKVFVAMQFNWLSDDMNKLKNEYVEAVKAACSDCGYEAETVAEVHHIDQITDKIIASIKKSKFVISDFTFNNRGAYYETGLARGLGIPIIHTVHKDHTNNKEDDCKRLHFDIAQINYIKWEDPSHLREYLTDRIKAVIE